MDEWWKYSVPLLDNSERIAGYSPLCRKSNLKYFHKKAT
jgi:hypothetical protein